MINTLVFLSVTLAVGWSFAPRFFRKCDTTLVRQRLHVDHRQARQNNVGSTKQRRKTQIHDFLSPRYFNELARLTRAHLPLHDAIQLVTDDATSNSWNDFARTALHQGSVETVLQDFSTQLQDDVSYHLLLASISDGVFIPVALDEAAQLLREQLRVNGDIEIAAAQARLTMKVLTRAPLFLLVVLALMSDSFRHVVTSSGVLVVIVIALGLNRLGAAWSTHLVRRLTGPSAVDEILDVITVLSVHLRAGLSLPLSCLRLNHVNQLGYSIAHAIQDGKPFHDAIQPLREHPDRFGHDIATILTTAFRDGQPAVDTIRVITDEARQHRDQQSHIQIRKLPTQLSAPVVLCALPAFMLLIVVPMFLSQLGALSQSFHTSTS